MTHIITISTDRVTGTDIATHGTLVARSAKSCAARKLARLMVAAGLPDGPIEARGTDGRVRYTVRSLVAFGLTILIEAPKLGVTRWRIHPFAGGTTEARTALGDRPATALAARGKNPPTAPPSPRKRVLAKTTA